MFICKLIKQQQFTNIQINSWLEKWHRDGNQ